jgi:hypothetical protein
VAGELPELIAALRQPLGEITDISVNWSSTDAAPDLNSMGDSAKSMPGWRDSRQRIMVIGGRRGRAKLLVVPHMTTPALGWMVLRRAAAVPIPGAEKGSQEFQIADFVVRSAQAESASWASREDDAQAAKERPATGSGDLSVDS